MVNLINKKPVFSNKHLATDEKNKVKKSKCTKNSKSNTAPHLGGKLPEFNVKNHIQKLDKVLLDSSVANIYNKTVDKKTKHTDIEKILSYIETLNPISIFQKRALLSLEACLKYGYEVSRNRVCKLFIDNHEGIMRSIFGLRLFVKILKYSNVSWKQLSFITLINKFLKDLNKEKTMYFANRAFLLLDEKQKRQLFAAYIGEDPNNEIVLKKSIVGAWRKTFPESFNSKLKELAEYIHTCMEINILSYGFVHYVINTFLNELESEELKSQISIFDTIEPDISRLQFTEDGILILSLYISVSDEDQRISMITKIESNLVEMAYLENSYIFYISMIHFPSLSSVILSKLLSHLVENFEKCILEQSWFRFVSFLISPREMQTEISLKSMQLQQIPLNFILKITQLLSGMETDFNVYLKEIYSPLKTHLLLNLINIILDPAKESLLINSILHFPEMRSEIYGEIIEIIMNPKNQSMLSSVKSFHIVLTKIIINDAKYTDLDFPSFSILLAEKLNSETINSWLQTTRTAFLIVRLLETKNSTVLEILNKKLPEELEKITSGPLNILDIIKKHLN